MSTKSPAPPAPDELEAAATKAAAAHRAAVEALRKARDEVASSSDAREKAASSGILSDFEKADTEKKRAELRLELAQKAFDAAQVTAADADAACQPHRLRREDARVEARKEQARVNGEEILDRRARALEAFVAVEEEFQRFAAALLGDNEISCVSVVLENSVRRREAARQNGAR